jgi:hypothetical protein
MNHRIQDDYVSMLFPERGPRIRQNLKSDQQFVTIIIIMLDADHNVLVVCCL